ALLRGMGPAVVAELGQQCPGARTISERHPTGIAAARLEVAPAHEGRAPRSAFRQAGGQQVLADVRTGVVTAYLPRTGLELPDGDLERSPADRTAARVRRWHRAIIH